MLTIAANDKKKKKEVAPVAPARTVLANSNDTLSYAAGMAQTTQPKGPVRSVPAASAPVPRQSPAAALRASLQPCRGKAAPMRSITYTSETV